MVQGSEKMRKIFAGRLDAAFLVGLAFISLLAWQLHKAEMNNTAKKVVVKVFSEPTQLYEVSLPASRTMRVAGRLGPAEIQFNADGEYRIASSTCPNGICVNYGWVKTGSVVCVPNGIVVCAEEKENTVDAVSR